jgi:hypothetical protein
MDITKALLSLRPNSAWTVDGNTYDGITWLDTINPQPTEEEISAEASRLQAEYESLEYQRQRAKNYPAIVEQLDMLYWDKVNGTNNWQTVISAVKNQFPKSNT